ncbi:hypothetical protein ACHAO8_009909 [Botrytis cinerea]
MDIKLTKELLYAVALIIAATIYFALTMAATVKTTKRSVPPEKPRCRRIQNIPLEVSRDSLETDLKKHLSVYGPECYLTLARSHSTQTATINSLKFANGFPYPIDETFLGITPIFDSDKASVDIVCIPGLGGHAIGSFKAKSNDYVWIRDFLPQNIITARILVYGYNTSITDTNSKYSISELARDFLDSIKALYGAWKGKEEPNNNYFFKSSYALMLFGVPNLGIRLDCLKEIVAGQPNDKLIQDLCLDEESEPTAFLRRLGESFLECCKEQQFEVVSYYEKRKTVTAQKVNGVITRDGPLCYMVTEDSACRIDHPNPKSLKKCSLDRDHTDLVKFLYSSDSDYQKVSSELEDLVSRAPQIVEARFALIEKLSEDEKLHLADLNMPHYANFKDTKKVQQAVEGTLQWLVTDSPKLQDHSRLQNTDFVKWRDSNQSCILLVTGAPGQGKSVLSNFVIDHLKEQQKLHDKVIYYFCNVKNEESSRTASSILRSFIVQLCEDRRLYQKLPTRFQNKGNFFAESLDNLWRVFLDLITTDTYTRIYCIIDGLDVYGSEMKDLLEYFNEHLKTIRIEQPLLKLLFTSRPEDFVMDIGFSPSKTLCASEKDLTTFIESELRLFNSSFNDNMKSLIMKAAKEGVGRTFLWISILLRELRKLKSPSRYDIENTIKQLPLELDTLYTNLVEKLLITPKYGVILAWITYAIRPLHFRELEDALAISMTKDARSLEDCEKSRIVLNSEVIQTHLGSLIDVIGPNPFLIHQTLRDFLKSSGILEKAEILNQFARPGMLLANTCISFLNFDHNVKYTPSTMEDENSVEDEDSTKDESSFLSYAANFWYEHIDTIEEAQHNIEQLRSILNAKGQALWVYRNRSYKLQSEEIPISIWTIAIDIDKEWLAKILTNAIPNSLTKELGDSYILPAAGSSLYVFQELLNGLYSERIPITSEIVEEVARNWMTRREMMELLLDKRGAEVVITEEVVKTTAGNWSSGKEVMKLLLEKRGAEVVITEEVVKAAAGNGGSGKEVMKLLFEKRGADIVITEEVVKAAVGNWSNGKEVMKLLLETRGAEVVITEEVVKATAGNRSSGEEVMKLLLEKQGAEVVITEETVKIIANRFGKEVMILLLEKQRAEVLITEEIIKIIVDQFGKEMITLLLAKQGAKAAMKEEIVKVIAGQLEEEVIMLLLEKRGREVVITEELLKIIVTQFDIEMIKLLLEGQLGKVRITEEVVKAAATKDRRGGEKVVLFLLEKRGEDVEVTIDLYMAVVTQNKMSGRNLMKLLLDRRKNGGEVTEEVR